MYVFPQVKEIKRKENECHFSVEWRLQAYRPGRSQQHIPWPLNWEEWTFFVAA